MKGVLAAVCVVSSLQFALTPSPSGSANTALYEIKYLICFPIHTNSLEPCFLFYLQPPLERIKADMALV